jgi:hypothetical protein
MDSSIDSSLLAREKALLERNAAVDRMVAAATSNAIALSRSPLRPSTTPTAPVAGGFDLGEDEDEDVPRPSSTAVPRRGGAGLAPSQLASAKLGISRPNTDISVNSSPARSIATSSGPGSKIPGFSRGAKPGSSSATAASSSLPSSHAAPSHGPLDTSVASSAASSTGLPPVSSLAEVDEHLPLEMQVKLLRSNLRVARQDIAELRTELSKANSELADNKKQVAAATDEKKRLSRAVTAAEAALDKAKKAA